MIRLTEIQKKTLNFKWFENQLKNQGFSIKNASPQGMLVNLNRVKYRIDIWLDAPSRPRFQAGDHQILHELIPQYYNTIKHKGYQYKVVYTSTRINNSKPNICILTLEIHII